MVLNSKREVGKEEFFHQKLFILVSLQPFFLLQQQPQRRPRPQQLNVIWKFYRVAPQLLLQIPGIIKQTTNFNQLLSDRPYSLGPHYSRPKEKHLRWWPQVRAKVLSLISQIYSISNREYLYPPIRQNLNLWTPPHWLYPHTTRPVSPPISTFDTQ